MIRSLKVISMALSLVAVGAFAFTPPTAQRASTTLWGISTLQRDSVVMMPASLEKESIKTTRGAVLERPQERVEEPTKQKKRMGSEAWEVRIYNDGLNTREHVARSLVQVTGMSESVAYQTMMQAHQNGIAVVGRWVYEVAEMYHDSLKDKGIICDIIPVDEDK
jgi:ATP-dependent Clp protease adaptor protein ClpS